MPVKKNTFNLIWRVLAHKRPVSRVFILLLLGCFLYFFFHQPDRFFEVVGDRFYRSAQLAPEDLDRIIKNKEIKTIINLNGNKSNENWFREEKKICIRNNVGLLNFDMHDSELPKNRLLNDIINVLKATEKPVLIHCDNGVNQTGLISAIALSLEKDPPLVVVEKQLSWKYGLRPAYRSMGTPMFRVYRHWLIRHSRDHSWQTFSKWLGDEYNHRLTPLQYYIDGINHSVFKKGKATVDDSSETLVIHGWAFWFSTKAPPPNFQLSIDQQTFSPVVFNRNRPDVARYYGFGAPLERSFIVGWELPINKALLSKKKAHRISLKIDTDDGIIAIPTPLTFEAL